LEYSDGAAPNWLRAVEASVRQACLQQQSYFFK